MTFFYKLAILTVVVALISTFLMRFYDFNHFLFYASLLGVFTLFIGLSGVFEKKTLKPLGDEVLGLSAVLLGSTYVVFALLFFYLLVRLYSAFRIPEWIPTAFTTLWFVLVVLYFLLPEDEDIKFGIMRPWSPSKYKDKIEKIEDFIEQYGYEYFLKNMDIDKFMFIIHFFDTQTQEKIFNSMNERTREFFLKKQEDSQKKELSDQEIEHIFNSILATMLDIKKKETSSE